MAQLLEAAREARSLSIATYSEFPVGAALRTEDGSVYRGANIEVVNYSNSLHAEEVALVRALMDGHRSFESIAVSGPNDDGLTPCGMCRQTLAEFCDGDFEVIVDLGDRSDRYSLETLLPEGMTAGAVTGE